MELVLFIIVTLFVQIQNNEYVTVAEEGEGQSLQLIRPCELYPKTATVMEEEGLVVPFNPLCGEFVAYVGRTATGVMALSNYRIYHQVTKLSNTFYNIPLGLVEQVEVKDLFLQISCKDATICRSHINTYFISYVDYFNIVVIKGYSSNVWCVSQVEYTTYVQRCKIHRSG
ncbi:Myotubularin- protein 4 [Homalodisca vitripennis]|nr:Myotubularin- protein 4 [Homalodisca vitripennis]